MNSEIKGFVLCIELKFEIMVGILPYYGHQLVYFIISKSETRFSNAYNAIPSAYTNLVKSENQSEC